MAVKPFGEMKELTGEGEYHAYFNTLVAAFNLVVMFYQKAGTQSAEGGAVSVYLQKILNTLRALELKYAFSPVHVGSLKVSLMTSGFPAWIQLGELGADIATREERLKSFPMPIHLLKEFALSELLTKNEEPRDLLWQIGQVSYLDALNVKDQFIPFTPGKISLFKGGPDGGRKADKADSDKRCYHFSWGVYDPEQHSPAVYIMSFLQDKAAKPLHEPGPHQAKFLEAVRGIAGRAPGELRSIGVRLDESLSDISPTIIRRIRFRSIVSPVVHRGSSGNAEASEICGVFDAAGLEPDDFLLQISVETLISGRQEVHRGLWGKPIRQIFFVPEKRFYPVAAERAASEVVDFVLGPHAFFQHVAAGHGLRIPMLEGAVRVPYTRRKTDKGVKWNVHESIR